MREVYISPFEEAQFQQFPDTAEDITAEAIAEEAEFTYVNPINPQATDRQITITAPRVAEMAPPQKLK